MEKSVRIWSQLKPIRQRKCPNSKSWCRSWICLFDLWQNIDTLSNEVCLNQSIAAFYVFRLIKVMVSNPLICHFSSTNLRYRLVLLGIATKYSLSKSNLSLVVKSIKKSDLEHISSSIQRGQTQNYQLKLIDSNQYRIQSNFVNVSCGQILVKHNNLESKLRKSNTFVDRSIITFN